MTATLEEQVSLANYIVLESNHDENMLMMGNYPAYLKGRIRGPKGHLSNNTSAHLLAEHATPRLKHVWLCHLSQENNKPELALNTISQTLEMTGIRVGEDVKVEVLRRTLPTGIFSLT